VLQSFFVFAKEEKMTPEEKRMIKIYERMTDEEIFSFVRNTTAELERIPTKKDFVCPWYLKERFGPWPRFLEAAGVKEIGERRKRRLQKKQQWRRNEDA